MRVLIVNTSEKTGGAAVAANRLMEALKNNGVKAKMLVRDKETDQITVVGLKNSWSQKWNFLWERWCIYMHLHLSRKHLFEIDIANAGSDITRLREFKEADVIHLNWINQGMLSLNGIKKILESGKPIIWTMHDFWPATAICHYPHNCQAYKHVCRKCRYLPGGGSNKDLAYKTWKRKMGIMKGSNITFVACSRWLADKAKQSGLLIGKNVANIPNPIDTKIFHPADKAEARSRAALPLDKKLILFVSQRITDKRKGMEHFIEACRTIHSRQPEMGSSTGVVILGGHSEEFADQLPFPVYPLGYINDERRILDVYNSVDVFVLPSLEDNLPNTIMEAMACGVPCVGFKTGGIPEMIDNRKNGYVADYQNNEDLAEGICWVLNNEDYGTLSTNAVHKVATRYSQQSVALKYIEVYSHAAAIRRYKL